MSLLASIAQAAKAAASKAAAAIQGAASSAAASASAAAAGAAAAASGAAAAVGTAGTAAIVATATVAVPAGAVAVNQVVDNPARYETRVEDCAPAVLKAAEVGEAGEQAGDELQMARNAQRLWSVFKGHGLTDDQVAGMLGNMQAESSIDPTCIEGYYKVKYAIDEKKSEIMADFDAHTRWLFGVYARQGTSINHEQYKGSDGKYYPGLGLVQWTSGKRLLDGLAGAGLSERWHELEVQVAFLLATGSTHTTGQYGGASYWGGYAEATKGMGAEQCAAEFARTFEGNTSMAQGARQEFARKWRDQMDGWTQDSLYYQSVLAMATQIGATEAVDAQVTQAADKCRTALSGSNATLAAASTTLAWPTEEQGLGNDGTPLFQEVYEGIWPGDGHYRDCGRAVSTAVKWSGTDMEFPVGPTATQYTHMLASDKWVEVGKDVWDEAALMPGDVFVTNNGAVNGDGHTFVYVGEAIVQQIHGTNAAPGTNSVHGSLDRNGPVAKPMLRDGRRSYTVFRCSKPDNADDYSHLGAGSLAGGVLPDRPSAAPGSGELPTDPKRRAVVEAARSMVGSSYVLGAMDPVGRRFDCSGLVMYCYGKAGIQLPRNSEDQKAKISKFKPVSMLEPGDVIWMPGHVGIYVGDGMIIDAGNPRTGVSLRKAFPGLLGGGWAS